MKPVDLNEFYVGYAGGVPRGTRRFVRGVVALFATLLLATAGLAATLQNPGGDGVFEFGDVRHHAGWIERLPHPVLVVPGPAVPGSDAHVATRHLLSAFGKHGADALFTGDDDAWYELDATLVHRDGRTMLEVVDDSVRIGEAPADAVRPVAAYERLGVRTLVGEIVDSKCFLGVMKPGNLKSHRACAVRCVSGGVPPVLLVRDAEGIATYHLLVDVDGSAVNERVLPLVALPVEVTGELERHGDLLVLRADPATYRRVGGFGE
ncbi:MAG: hypothetical protein R3F34_19415 [Planctomycetota bacterium]